MVEGVIAGHGVERAVVERQVLSVGDPGVEAACRRGGNRRLGAVDADHFPGCIEACQTAVPTADVEHPFGSHLGEGGQERLLLVEIVESQPAGPIGPPHFQAAERGIFPGDGIGVIEPMHDAQYCRTRLGASLPFVISNDEPT